MCRTVKEGEVKQMKEPTSDVPYFEQYRQVVRSISMNLVRVEHVLDQLFLGSSDEDDKGGVAETQGELEDHVEALVGIRERTGRIAGRVEALIPVAKPGVDQGVPVRKARER